MFRKCTANEGKTKVLISIIAAHIMVNKNILVCSSEINEDIFH